MFLGHHDVATFRDLHFNRMVQKGLGEGVRLEAGVGGEYLGV